MSFITPAKPVDRATSALAFLASCLMAGTALAQQSVPVCVPDESIRERFIPVELLTGNPVPAPESRDLVLAPVDRVYPFIDELPDGKLGSGDVVLKGPIPWKGQDGKDHEGYERKVPRAHEVYAMTDDKTAFGRVYDQRIGNIVNEGKFPIGLWKQGEKRSYSTTYYAQRGGARLDTSSLEIEKLSCSYEGIPGAMQFGWRSGYAHYGYIYAPGKGLVHVMTRVRANRS